MSLVEEGDLIYDSDNERTYLVEAKDKERNLYLFVNLEENEKVVFTEYFINEYFDIGFWRFAKTS